MVLYHKKWTMFSFEVWWDQSLFFPGIFLKVAAPPQCSAIFGFDINLTQVAKYAVDFYIL
jgi:hypothetical protein